MEFLEEKLDLLTRTVSNAILFLLLMSILTSASGIQLARANEVDSWPTFHHDPNRTGTSTSTGPTTNQTLWSYTTGGSVEFSSPAVAGGLVYVGADDHNVYCLNATNGSLVWRFKTGNLVESSPTVADDLIYVGSDDFSIYCLNATNGSLVWSYKTGGQVWSSPSVASGLIYIGSDDHNVYCLNGTSGALVWNYTTNGNVESSPAVAGDLVYVGSDDFSIYCLNATNGSLVWRYATSGFVWSSPAVVNGEVYVGSTNYKIYAFSSSLEVPEFPSYVLLSLFLMATLLAVFVLKTEAKRKNKRKRCH